MRRKEGPTAVKARLPTGRVDGESEEQGGPRGVRGVGEGATAAHSGVSLQPCSKLL